MVERRSKGLCCNCDKSYSAGHRCKRIFCLLVEDHADEYELEEEIPLEISLHAITGIRNSQTMQLHVLVNRHPMLGLVDSGSTHNFISESTSIRFGL